MEFEYTGTIYFDIDYLVVSFCEGNYKNLDSCLNDYIYGLDDYEYYAIESWMLDEVKTEMMKYEGVKSKVQGD